MRPAGVLQTLGELAAVNGTLDLDYVDMALTIQGHDVGAQPTTNSRLAGNREQRLTDKRLEIAPEEFLNLLLILVLTSLDTPERNKFFVASFEQWHRQSPLGR